MSVVPPSVKRRCKGNIKWGKCKIKAWETSDNFHAGGAAWCISWRYMPAWEGCLCREAGRRVRPWKILLVKRYLTFAVSFFFTMQIVEIEIGRRLDACRKARFCFWNSVILYIGRINMLFCAAEGRRKLCRRRPFGMQKTVFGVTKDHLWQDCWVYAQWLSNVSGWYKALYVECRKTPFFTPNGVLVRAVGLLRGLTWLWLTLPLT